MRSLGFLLLAIALSAPAGAAAHQEGGKGIAAIREGAPPWPDRCLRTTWDPSEAELARWFSSKRVTAGTAPDGSRAVEIRADGGGPNQIAQLLAPLGHLKAEEARISVEIFFERGYAFNPKGSAKFPLGLWGGEKNCISGGCGPAKQTGFSVRLTHAHGTDGAQPSIYSYHLNRGKERKDKEYGWGYPLEPLGGKAVSVPTGAWVRATLDVALNTPGEADGWARAEMSQGGRTIAARSIDGIQFRDDKGWTIRGPILTDMWGGDINKPANFPPKTQKSWYRNLTISVPKGDRCG